MQAQFACVKFWIDHSYKLNSSSNASSFDQVHAQFACIRLCGLSEFSTQSLDTFVISKQLCIGCMSVCCFQACGQSKSKMQPGLNITGIAHMAADAVTVFISRGSLCPISCASHSQVVIRLHW